MASNKKVVNDIVHGLINLPPHIVAILDTPLFLRLKFITQLGHVSNVYPSASYSRFEHSIGTFHLASGLIKQIQRQIIAELLDVTITDEEIKCVEIAALCHDLGHGPYSHFWEHAIDLDANDLVTKPSHEELSVEILKDLRKKKKVKDVTEGLDFDLISMMILGKYDEDKDPNRKYVNKKFLFEIVANKVSGLDVDKFDYLCRDWIYLGWSNKNKIHDIKRTFNFIRVIDYEGEWRLAIRDREIFHIYDIFYSRHMLHRYGCHHKTVKAVECMFKNALAIIVEDPNLLKEFIHNVIKIPDDRGEYTKMFLYSKEFINKSCDFHVWNMMCKHCPDIVKDIQERRLYQLYCKLQINLKEENTPVDYKELSEGVKKLEKFINGILQEPVLINEYVNMVLSKFSLSSEKAGDPISLIPFYKKGTPNEGFQFREDRVPPNLVRFINDDYVLMIFTRNKPGTHNETILNNFKKILLKNTNSERLTIEIRQFFNDYKFTELNY